MNPELLAETERWLVLAKPPGWLSVPPSVPEPAATARPVLSAWLRERYAAAFPVHRLDVETSGVILFARSEAAHREANQWFQKHEVRKLYQALASGTPATPVFRVNEPVAGSAAVTQFEVKERFADAFLCQAVPLTGRRHQIRRHLAARGHAILGDREYGGPVLTARVALHAARLVLPGGESFEAPWPEDFAGWVNSRRSSG